MADAVLALAARSDGNEGSRSIKHAAASLSCIVQSGEALDFANSVVCYCILVIGDFPFSKHCVACSKSATCHEPGTDSLSRLRARDLQGRMGTAAGASGWTHGRALDTGGRMRLLADMAPSVQATHARLAQLLVSCRAGDAERRALLSELLAHCAPLRLRWCAELVAAEAQHLQARCPSLTGRSPDPHQT